MEQLYDLDDLLRNYAEHQDYVRCRIRTLRSELKLAALESKMLLKDAKLSVSLDAFNHFMGGNSRLGEEDYVRLVRHLWDNKWFSGLYQKQGAAKGDDAFFHALSNFLNVGAQTIQDLAREAPGIYRVWRPSMHVPGQFVRGKMTITLKAETAALHVRETHVYKGEEHAAPQTEIFEGCLVKKSGFLIVVSRQAGSHGGPPRITMLHHTVPNNEGVLGAMQGVVTGTYGATLFSAPVYIERVPPADEAGLDATLDITDKIPASVMAKLRFLSSDNVIRF